MASLYSGGGLYSEVYGNFRHVQFDMHGASKHSSLYKPVVYVQIVL
jgi:hypothetical protein